MNNDYEYMIEILTALKDGKTIQFQDMFNEDRWYDIETENFVPNFETDVYRIKIDVKSYRIAIIKSKHGDLNCRYPIIVHTEEIGIQIQSDYNFICWHTDWMDY